jgi:signal transduction histidine kinase
VRFPHGAQDPDAPLRTLRLGNRPGFTLAAVGVAVAAVLFLRFRPVGVETRLARERLFLERAEAAFEADARRLMDIAARLQRTPDFAAIVDGGGAEVRPSRLFSVLSAGLPGGEGWGAVFLDGEGRAVAWSGDAAGLAAERGFGANGFVASFHVTRFTLAFASPRGDPAEKRGVLVVSRRYPTGLLRPDAIEFFGLRGGPTLLRLRVKASGSPGRLLALAIERVPRGVADDDAARARARGASILAGSAFLVLGLLGGAPAAGIVAARLVIVLGEPRADSGVWRPLLPGGGLGSPFLGLVSTPAGLFLTGLAVLAVLRLALGSPRVTSALAGAARRAAALRTAAGVALLAVLASPYLFGRAVGLARSDLFDSLNLAPGTWAATLAHTGAVAVAAGFIGGAALAIRAVVGVPRPVLLACAGVLCLAGGLLAAGSISLLAISIAAGGFFALALSERIAAHATSDLLRRSATAVFLAAAGSGLLALGLADGKLRRLDDALAAAAHDEAPEREARRRAWEQRVRDVSLEPWLPAGDRTLVSDLARALWVRGALPQFPEIGDTLRLYDSQGRSLSSFGVTSPGTEAAGVTSPASVPLPVTADWLRVPYPRESDRDPLLSAVVSRDQPDRVPVERVEWDAAGRPRGGQGTDRQELPRDLLAGARRSGTAMGQIVTTSEVRRIRVGAAQGGFVGFAASGDSPLVIMGAAVAGAEASLAVLLPLLAWSARRDPRGPRAAGFGTYRTRLMALFFVFGALPLAGSVLAVRFALESHSAQETARRARRLLSEARRALESATTHLPGPPELNRAAAVIGSDLLFYHDGRLDAASRALPVAAEVAAERLAAPVAQALAEGRNDAVAPVRRLSPGTPRVVEAAEALSPDGRDALAVVVPEDEAGRLAVDGLVLFTVFVALGAFGLGGRAALSLSKPVDDLVAGAERIGEGAPAPPIERPRNPDLARLVEAFEAMSARVKERTESLARERAAAVGLVSNLTAAVILYTRDDMEVLIANPAADRILPGGDLADRLSRTGWEPLKAALEEAASRLEPFETRIAGPGAEGERLYRVVVVALAPDAASRRSILLLEDLTDFIRADRLAAWVEAARSIAHDIKNPLTPIRLSAERLQRFGDRGETPAPRILSEVGANVLRQVSLLTERIGRLARFSDPATADRRRLDRAAVDHLLRDVASDYSANECVTVTVDVPGSLAPLLTDPAVLRDALTNFVVNALEAVGPAKGSVCLSARDVVDRGVASIRFACADDGPGVPEDALQRLFEPTFSTKSRGSGMGLAAVRRAVERHGGRVFAEARPGGGLAIGFFLPALSSNA